MRGLINATYKIECGEESFADIQPGRSAFARRNLRGPKNLEAREMPLSRMVKSISQIIHEASSAMDTAEKKKQQKSEAENDGLMLTRAKKKAQ